MGQPVIEREDHWASREPVQAREGCAILGRRSIILAVQEVLSKSDDPKIPLREQEFFELSLLDTVNDLGTRYCVRQAHAE
jgi:hypothetical protein